MKRLSVPSQTTQFWFWFILFCCLIGSIFPDYITRRRISNLKEDTSSPVQVPVGTVGVVNGVVKPSSLNKSVKSNNKGIHVDTKYLSDLEDYVDNKFSIPKFSITKNSSKNSRTTSQLNLLELEYIDFNATEPFFQFDLSQLPKGDELVEIFKAEFERTEDQLKDAYYRSITIIEDKFPNLSIKEGEQKLRSFISNYLGDSEYLSELKKMGASQSTSELRDNLPLTQEIGEWIEPYADSEHIVAEFDRAIKSIREGK